MTRIGMWLFVVCGIVLAWAVAMWVHGLIISPAPATELPIPRASPKRGPCLEIKQWVEPNSGAPLSSTKPGPKGYVFAVDKRCASGTRWVKP